MFPGSPFTIPGNGISLRPINKGRDQKNNHLVMGKNKIMTSAANWMELGIISSKRSQIQEGEMVASFLSDVKSRMTSAGGGTYTNRARK